MNRFRLSVAAAALALAAAACPAGSADAEEIGTYAARALQEELLLHGYNPGPATGQVGPQTLGAVAAYRHDAELPRDAGLYDVLAHLRYAAPRVVAKRRQTPHRSDPSPTVAAAQVMLRALGYFEGPVDGRDKDGATAASLARFRADRNLRGSGGVDRAALAELKAATEAAAGQGRTVPPAGRVADGRR
ncbi:MAG TPA: peptidoglycan-binding domain-containing protein [Stellaceae bacterium]